MADVIYGFYKDRAFLPSETVVDQYVSEGMFIPSVGSSSYFNNTKSLQDGRTSRTWFDGYISNTAPYLLVDGNEYPTFLGDFETIPSADRDAFFNILDRVFILSEPSESVSNLDTTLQNTYSIFKAGSLTLSSTRKEAVVYSAGGTLVEVPTWAGFTIASNNGVDTVEYDFKIWVGDAEFKEEYPLSTIVEMVPLLSYPVILNNPLTGGGYNVFDPSKEAAERIRDIITPKLSIDNLTGLYLHDVKMHDTLNNIRNFPFGILHKGRVPSILDIRNIIREEVLGSGVGTEQNWRDRAPELFIVDQFYLIPQWNITAVRPDGITYPNVGPIGKMIQNTRLALPFYSPTYIEENIEVMGAAYDQLTLTAVPNEVNLTYTSVQSIHPTYQSYSSSEPGYANMEQHTKLFSQRLNEAAAVASGAVSNELYPQRIENGSIYIPFIVGTTEYYVMTKDSFLNQVGA
jgi:hypothetical protein